MGLNEILTFIFRSLSFPISVMRGISRYTFSFVSNLIFRNNNHSLLPPPQLPQLLPSSMSKLESVSVEPKSHDPNKSTFPRESNSKNYMNNQNPTSMNTEDKESVIQINIQGRREIEDIDQGSKRKYENKDNCMDNVEASFLSSEDSLSVPLPSVINLKPPPPKKYRHDEKNETSAFEIQTTGSLHSGSSFKSKDGKDKTNAESKTPRVNYFVAFEVSQPEIKQKICEVQDSMMSTTVKIICRKKRLETLRGDIFKDALVSAAKLHFTLRVIHLKDDEDKEKAKMAVHNVWKEYRRELEEIPIEVKIAGIGHFHNKVLFAKMQGENEIRRLTELANKLEQEFESMNIFGETRPFTPHMTIAKISKSRKLQNMNIRTFPSELWKDFEYYDFGIQKFAGIQLLSMQDTNPESGYYQALAEFPLN